MNTTKKQLTCGFIGLGLIGGSIAKAIRKAHPRATILAYDTNKKTLQQAQKEGIVNTPYTSLDPALGACDYLFLCTPVARNNDYLPQIKPLLQPGCMLTDVGSTKSAIHQEIKALELEHCFIGGHPMAGKEKTGFANAAPDLLANAYYILTPTRRTPPDHVFAYQELVASIGCIPLALDYHQHDYIAAAISHVPHVIAYSLVNLIRDCGETTKEQGELIRTMTAGGFKDTTRIASSSPVMWQEVCLTNADNIKQLLTTYINALQQICGMLDTQDAEGLHDLFASAKTYRDSIIES